jgi:hypothetical protein
MTAQIILAVLSAIEALLPLLGTKSDTIGTVDKVITALEKLLPAITDWTSTVYNVVKNILSLLRSNGGVSDDQMSALIALDNKVDAAWAEMQAKIDPDAGISPNDP